MADPAATHTLDPRWDEARRQMDAAQALMGGGFYGLAKQQGWQGPAWADAVYNTLQNPEVQAALGVIGPLKSKIKAYHGSPYDFDKFDMSRIGSGEGAQAYGHGLYFAENEGTAKSYRDSLSDLQSRKVEGTDYALPSWVAKKIESRNPAAIDDVRKDFQGRIVEMQRKIDSGEDIQPWVTQSNIVGLRGILAGLDHVEQGAKVAPAGRMYEVAINADPEHFLDWDRPVGPDEQWHVFEKMRKAGLLSGNDIESVMRRELHQRMNKHQLDEGPAMQHWYDELRGQTRATDDDALLSQLWDKQNIIEKWWNEGIGSGDLPTGQTYIRQLADRLGGPEKAAAALREAGIPGLRYLDQGSRHLKEGTSNYVVFDDKLVEIIKKYGWAAVFGGVGAEALGRREQ